MTGKILGGLLSMSMMLFFLLMTISFHLHMVTQERVRDICYDVAEIISTRGELTEEVYEYFQETLSRYGAFHVEWKLVRQKESVGEDVFFDPMDIVGVELAQGDLVSIVAVSLEPSLLERLLGSPLRAAAIQTAVIA